MASRYQAIKVGGPFETVRIDRPVPKAGEVLIQLKAIGLNPVDWKQLMSGHGVGSWPAVFGNEGAGVVEAVGAEVQAFKKGDKVLARFDPVVPASAAFQDFSVIPATHVAPKPESLSYEDAASIPFAPRLSVPAEKLQLILYSRVGYMTAASAIYQALEIPLPFLNHGREDGYIPKSILVLGGSSSVGAATIQLLRIALPNAVIISTSSPKHHAHLKSLGATAVLDYTTSDILQQIKRASPNGAGVEALIDAVNSVALNYDLLHALMGPKLFAEVVTGQMAKDIPADVKHILVFGRKVMSAPGGSNLFVALGELLKSGKYNLPLPVTVTGLGLDAVEPGLEALKAGVSGTKLVVKL